MSQYQCHTESGVVNSSSGSLLQGSAVLRELGGNWRVLLGVVIGLSAGAASTLGYSHGALIEPLEAEFGWSRASLSLGLTAFGVAILFVGPRWGALADRFGSRPTATVSLIIYGTLLALMPHLLSYLPFWLLYFVTAAAGCGAAAPVLAKSVNDHFGPTRGIALGIAFAGIGLGAFWVPLVTHALIGWGGWSFAYYGLAIIAFATAPLVWMLIPNMKPEVPVAVQKTNSADDVAGKKLGEALRGKDFWLLIAIGAILTLGIVGMTSHMIPLLHASGETQEQAVVLASILGLSSMAARLMVGFALDHVKARTIAFAIPTIAACGIALLFMAPQFSVVAVLLIGFAFGSEVDMIAYFTSRYFGKCEFGRIYGWMFGTFAIAGGTATYISGSLYDHFGDYDAAITLSLIFALAASLLGLFLGPYRYRV